MKSIKFVLVAILITFSNVILASTNPTEDKVKMTVISKQISKLLENPSFPVERNSSITVRFTVNNNNEIVVLSVEAAHDKELIESYIKSRLNYKKLKSNVKSSIYTLPIKMVSL
ncbi:hypothetical protein [Tenacibaculum sp. 190524A05c]|uniref:TonB C-terminal domain-containing protein n=1 Tax=Tenacibaculum platacis TaxID=3137852 RepID=A0ABM9NQ01_9FLAO